MLLTQRLFAGERINVDEKEDIAASTIIQAEQRTDFWMKVAAITFGLWSIAIPIGVAMMRTSIQEVVSSQERFQQQFTNYVLTMERRVTLLEERQTIVMKKLERIDDLHDSGRR